MFCFFLNVHKFVSKAGNHCYILTIASPEGEVSEFFVTEDLYQQAVELFNPFDYIELVLTASRGRISVTGFTHALRSE